MAPLTSSQVSSKASSWFVETTKAVALVRIRKTRGFITILLPWGLPQGVKKSNSGLLMGAEPKREGVIAHLPPLSVRLSQVKAVTLMVKENARIGGIKARIKVKIRRLKMHQLEICLSQTLWEIQGLRI